MNIFLRELRNYRKSTLIWTSSLSTLVIAFLLMFPGFSKDVETFQKVLANLPPVLRDALGISLDNFFTVYGFFAYLITFASLAGAIQAMNLGVGAISREDSGKTADFLLTKPVSRANVVTGKLLAVTSLLIFTNVIFSFAGLITVRAVAAGDFSFKIIFLISATLFLIQLAFLALGFLLSVIIPKIKSVISVSLPIVFSFFIIGTMGAVLGNENVKYITPFKFYDPVYIVNNGAYETRFLLIEIALLIAAIVATYIIYINKDIRAVS